MAQRLKAVRDHHGVPIKAVALQFGLGHPAVAAILTARRAPEEIDKDLKTVGVPI